MLGFRSSLGAATLFLLALSPCGTLAHRWYNWKVDITCEADGLFVPEDEADLVRFVKAQHAKKTMLRPVGNGHGFGNLTTCVNVGETERDSYILSLTNLKHLQVNSNNNTVTFGAGWDLIDLIPALHEHGLQVQNLGSEKMQNYIGAATTGTHGTGKQNQNLATQIIGFRVLDARGNIHLFNEHQNPDLLKDFRVSIGTLGIITEVTLQADPPSYMKRTSKVIQGSENITELYAQIAEIGVKYQQVNIIGPNLDWDSDRQDLVLKPIITLVYWENTSYGAVKNCSDYCANDCGRCDRDYHCYDYKMNAIATPPPGVCYRGFMEQFEHFVPIEHLADAGIGYLTHAKSQAELRTGYRSDDVTVITRFIKGDNTWLSPLNTYGLQPNAGGELASEFIPLFGEKYDVRPHWNKMIFHNETYTQTIFPKMDDWLEIQEKMDPDCQFVNEFLVSSLGIKQCEAVFN
ncbi:FAD/FMN-containing dehydrogenase [Aspergillus foveolatus]|uniref:FAD/FMN-containing dehydrogenase n=1 Tax=Aspergillus foveolatus TaxID=210207 RepID=UPI003CCE39C9